MLYSHQYQIRSVWIDVHTQKLELTHQQIGGCFNFPLDLRTLQI